MCVEKRAEQWLTLLARPLEATERESVVRYASAVAQAVRTIGLDTEAVASAWVVSLPDALAPTAEEVRDTLGRPVADLVSAVRQVVALSWQHLHAEQAETLRRTFLAMAHDVRGVIVALALRLERLKAVSGSEAPAGSELHNLACETLEVHAALASRLGVSQLKWPLEDTAFRLLEPQTYGELKALIDTTRDRRESLVSEIVSTLQELIRNEGLSGRVTGRPKHLYSVYRKMKRKQVSFEEVYDLTAVRVITNRVQDCYAILGLVHSLWVPIPHEMDDYIAMPKPNGYQSLHTAVIGPGGRAVEIQIRTEQMHQFAEYGVAAHWAYKEGRADNSLSERFTLIRQLLELEQTHSDAESTGQLGESLHAILFSDQVFVFTPKGKIVELTQGATPLDFAYRIHTEVGHRCKGARVNDQIAPLTSKLNTGDRVEILTHREAAPSRDWMVPSRGFLTSSRARGHVRSWFRAREPEPVAPPSPKQEPPLEQPNVPPPAASPSPPTVESARGIVLDDVDDILGRRANCCSPLPGDEVVGFITRGRGLTLHRKACAQLEGLPEPERIVEVHWGASKHSKLLVSLNVSLVNDAHSFSKLVDFLSKIGEPLTSATQLVAPPDELKWQIQLRLRDKEHEQRVLAQLRAQKNVLDVAHVRA